MRRIRPHKMLLFSLFSLFSLLSLFSLFLLFAVVHGVLIVVLRGFLQTVILDDRPAVQNDAAPHRYAAEKCEGIIRNHNGARETAHVLHVLGAAYDRPAADRDKEQQDAVRLAELQCGKVSTIARLPECAKLMGMVMRVASLNSDPLVTV